MSALGWWRAIWPVFISFMLLPVGVVWMTTSLASAAAQNPRPTSGSVVPSILLMIGGPFLMVGFGLFWMWRNQRIARRNQWTAFSERPENAAFAEPIEKFFLLRARWSLGSFGREQTASAAAAATALRAGCASRIALAPPSIAPLLELHAAPVGLLEPEEIGHSFSKQQALMVLLPLLCAALAWLPALPFRLSFGQLMEMAIISCSHMCVMMIQVGRGRHLSGRNNTAVAV